MNKPIINSVAAYIKSQSRNKIVFYSQDVSDIATINVGKRISEVICNFKKPGKTSIRVAAEVDNMLNAAISNHEVLGRYLSVKNIGILFEPELKLDFTRLLDRYSQNNVLFVRWDGEMDGDNIYFLTKANGIKINIKNLSYIAI